MLERRGEYWNARADEQKVGPMFIVVTLLWPASLEVPSSVCITRERDAQ